MRSGAGWKLVRQFWIVPVRNTSGSVPISWLPHLADLDRVRLVISGQLARGLERFVRLQCHFGLELRAAAFPSSRRDWRLLLVDISYARDYLAICPVFGAHFMRWRA